jgi:hypothetical protein
MEPHIPEDNLNPKPSNLRFGGLFNTHQVTNNNIFRGFPHSNFNRNLGLGVAVCGLGLSSYACYQYRLSALAAMKAAEAAVKAAEAAMKAVDLSEVQAGIRSRESYETKYPDNSRK